MRSLVVYYSGYGNRRRIAEAISEILESGGSVRLISTDQITIVERGDLPRDGEIDLLHDGEIARAMEWARSILKRMVAQSQ